jgi:3-oxoacyl-(acyl-carrier-protein) synthase
MRQQHHTERRVVITGMGIVSPNGIGKEAFWHATSNGISGIKPIQNFPTDDLSIKIAGEVSPFSPLDYIDRKLVNRTDRMTHFAFAAIQEALKDAHLVMEEEDPNCVGTVIANSMGGVNFALEQMVSLYTRGPRYVSAYTAIAWLQVANSGQASIRYGFKGYSKTPVNDTVGGLDALGIAYSAIRRGAADVLITGGCEAFLHPFSLVVFGQMSEYTYCITGSDPTAYRPFDQRAAGMIVAEGAGICIVEEYEHARRRGAPIYGEIVGYGQTNDANGPTPPSFNGTQYARAIRLAMQEGNLSAQDIGYFSPDGRAIPQSDQGEAEALHLVFGADTERLPITVPRTMIGQCYGASGAIDGIAALLSLQHKLIPPTINCEELNPAYGLDLVRDEARPMSQPAILVAGRGIGGTNVVVAVKKVE